MTGEPEDRRRQRFAIVKTATGEIRARITATESAAERNLREGETLLNIEAGEDIAGQTHYAQEGVILERPVLALEEPTAGVVPEGGAVEFVLPDGAEVHIDGELAGEAAGGGIAIEFPIAGQYDVEVRAFPYKTARVTVTVE